MAGIVNLRQARKAKARADKANMAETNRALHGRTASERQRDLLEKQRAAAVLDQVKRSLS